MHTLAGVPGARSVARADAIKVRGGWRSSTACPRWKGLGPSEGVRRPAGDVARMTTTSELGSPWPSPSKRGALALAVAASTLTLAMPVNAGFGISPRDLVREGMEKFRKGDVAGSIGDFDALLKVAPSQRPYLWQRGLSLYYADKFEEGAMQFRDDVAVNPNDTEEAIWTYLCEAQLYGPDQAQQQFLKVGRDPRPVMRAAYELFAGRAGLDQLEAAAGNDKVGHDRFYSLLYIALWHEAHGDSKAAQDNMTAAVQTPYAQRSNDYMASLAFVHMNERGWPIPAAA